jgi:hypothetical protein
MADKMGYGRGYDEAFTAGLLRVAFMGFGRGGDGEAYLETDKRMSPELEKIVLKAIKRFPKGYGLEFVSGSGTGFQKRFDWDGRQLVPQRRQRNVYEDFNSPAKKAVDKWAIEKWRSSEFIKRVGSKTAPINGHGWLFPSGRFVPNGYERTHLGTAKMMGFFHDYEDAYKAGLLRVVVHEGFSYFETIQKMSPKLESFTIREMKRISDLVDFELKTGSGTEYYQAFQWDGKQLKLRRGMW